MFSRADIGGGTGFAFYVRAANDDANGNTLARDWAPDGGKWEYDLATSPPTTTTPTTTTPTPPPPPAVKPVIGSPTSVPAKLVAGKRVVLTYKVTRSDGGGRFEIEGRKVMPGLGLVTCVPVTIISLSGGPDKQGEQCSPAVLARVTAAGKPLNNKTGFAKGVARVSFTVPKTAKNKQLRVVLTIKSGLKEASRTTTFRIG